MQYTVLKLRDTNQNFEEVLSLQLRDLTCASRDIDYLSEDLFSVLVANLVGSAIFVLLLTCQHIASTAVLID